MIARDKPLGRPCRDEQRVSMGNVTFRLDEEGRSMLRALEDDLPPGTVGRRSVLLRKLIVEAFRAKK